MTSIRDDLMPGGPVNRLFNAPANLDLRIWRYLSFEKFLALLEFGQLAFPRADKLGDPFEGAIPIEDVRVREDQIEQVLPNYLGLEERRESIKKEMIANDIDFRKLLPSRVYVSCWHLSEFESDFWHHYADRTTAVCIQSTFRRLLDVTGPFSVVGAVRYLDYDKEKLPGDAGIPYGPYFHKRNAYRHESEVRSVIWRVPRRGAYVGETPEVLGAPLDPAALIQAVYLSPYSPDWFKKLVPAVFARYKIGIPLSPSGLSRPPDY